MRKRIYHSMRLRQLKECARTHTPPFHPGELTHTRFYVAVPYVTVTVAVAEPPLLLVAVPTYVPGAFGTRKLVLSGWV
jgi:hypothetical protein